jgi:hypothetical protein
LHRARPTCSAMWACSARANWPPSSIPHDYRTCLSKFIRLWRKRSRLRVVVEALSPKLRRRPESS